MQYKKPLGFILNFLILPGLGNVMLGAKKQGSVQILLALLSFLAIGLASKETIYVLAIVQATNYIPPETTIRILGFILGGLVLGLIALGWAAYTYYEVLKQSDKQPD